MIALKDRRGLYLPYSPVVVASADPAAGAEFSITVPASELWLVHAVSVSLVQGITQTPFPALVVDDGTTILGQFNCGTAAMNASVTAQCSWASGVPAAGGAADTVRQGSLPIGLVLPAAYRLRSLTGGIGANSNYGIASALVSKLSLT